MNLESTIEWVHERHDHWFNHLDRHWALLERDGVKPPKCQIKLNAPRAAGWHRRYFDGRQALITYFVCYAISEGREAYDGVIAHEMCHHFQQEFLPGCSNHGEMFLYLLRTVCGQKDAKRCHTFSVRKAQKIADVIQLSRELAK